MKPDHTLHNLLFDLTAAKNALQSAALQFDAKALCGSSNFDTSAQTRLYDTAIKYADCLAAYNAAVTRARKEGK
jgi:hypothetical protein